MLKTSVGILLGALAAASLPPAASAVPISYVVNRVLGPSVQGGEMTVVGTVTVEDTGPTVTDWDITITSTALGRSFSLNSGNSDFFSSLVTLTPTAAKLIIDVGDEGIWGPELRDDAMSLRHEWFLREEADFIEQAFLDFAAPDSDFDGATVSNSNPTILFAVSEPAAWLHLVAALAAVAAIGRGGFRC